MARRYLLLGIVLAVAFGLVVATFLIARQWESRRTYNAFRAIASDRAGAVEVQLLDQLSKIEYLRAVYRSSDETAEYELGKFVQEFRRLAQEAFADDREIRTIVFAPRVTAATREAITAWIRVIDGGDFEIVDMDTAGRVTKAAPRSTYYPVVAAEPAHANGRLKGVDLWIDPNARDAMVRALESGDVIASPPIYSDAGSLTPNDFRIFAALHIAMPTEMADGYLMLSLKVDQIVERALAGLRAGGVDVLVYDHEAADTLLYTHVSRTRTSGDEQEAFDPSSAPEFDWQTDLSLASRTWRIVARPSPAFFESQTNTLSTSVLAGGLLSATILLVFLLLDMRRANRIEALVAERTEQLTHEVKNHKSSEEALKISQERTTNAVLRMDRHVRKIELLSEMGDMLQACTTLAEAYEVTARFVQLLFPAECGTLHVYGDSRAYLESAASWGDHPIDGPLLRSEECWALRRGKLHISNTRDLICPHIMDFGLAEDPHLCLPLLAHGETLGMIHLSSSSASKSATAEPMSDGDASSGFSEAMQRLGSACAEHAALAIANIRLRETLRQQSVRDPLTGLFNRRHMEESLDREIHRAQRSDSRLGLIVIDIDFFKRFNDEHGHDAGDHVLTAVAEFFQRSMRKEDIVCRFGGEEFVAVLPGASKIVTAAKAEELREKMQTVRVKYGGDELPGITISAGVAMLGQSTATRDELFRAADEALYRAKAAGRDRVELYEDDEGETDGTPSDTSLG